MYSRDNQLDLLESRRLLATFLVTSAADDGEGSLRDAIEQANVQPGADVVEFDETMHGALILLGGTQLSIRDDLTINGPGRDLLTVDGNRASRVFLNYAGARSTIRGLTVTGGFTESDIFDDGHGGGIRNHGSLDLIDLLVKMNSAQGMGGGVLNLFDGELTLTNVTVSENSADAGGGISSDDKLVVIDSRIEGNTASSGGGIFSIGSVVLNRTVVSRNDATSSGGGIDNFVGSLTINDSTISYNTAYEVVHGFGSGYGGGISNYGPFVMSNSTVSGNSGGGIDSGSGSVTITNSTISENTGGGFYNWSDVTEPSVVRSSIIAGNTNANGSPSDVIASFTSGSSHNLIGHGSGVSGLINGIDGNIIGVDPLLGPLSDNGGPTQTHALLPGSPAIDAGSNPSSLEIDQRGYERTVGGGTDIGAFEFNDAPLLSSLTTSTRSALIGQSVTIDAGSVSDSDGWIARVRFYLDLNANGILEEGELLGIDESGEDGFTLTVPIADSLGVGDRTFLAVAEDGHGLSSAPAARTITIAEPTSIGSPNGAANAANVHRVVSVNTLGHVLVYREGWTYENVTQKAGAPAAISSAVIWTDPKDGLTYAAAPSAAGLILFTRHANGSWSFRNLSAETGATGSPVGDLTQFVSRRQKIVVIAGITESGRIVAFRQSLQTISPGVRAFEFVDISGDLEAQGQVTPELTGLTSYVPRWDTWHLAGIDGEGRIQSIWINPNNPAFTRWRANDLSANTGAPALAGQLAVTLTAWGGINLTGLDASGEMLTTWWVPRFGGQWAVSNLTERYAGPRLVGGNLTAYTTPWGGVNYVGIDGDGDVRVYWWVPSFGGTWAISRLLPSGTPAASLPTGRLTSYASRAGTLSVFGTNEAGDDLRLTWRPGFGSVWAIENLSEIAIEN